MLDLLFIGLLLACCGYAVWSGGSDGVRIAIMLVTATALSIPAGHIGKTWHNTQLPVLAIDILLLAGLLVVAFRTRSYWPLWMTAFHSISVLSHVATVAQNSLRPVVYFSLAAFWSLPLLLVMVIGIMLDRRAWRARYGKPGTGSPG